MWRKLRKTLTQRIHWRWWRILKKNITWICNIRLIVIDESSRLRLGHISIKNFFKSNDWQNKTLKKKKTQNEQHEVRHYYGNTSTGIPMTFLLRMDFFFFMSRLIVRWSLHRWWSKKKNRKISNESFVKNKKNESFGREKNLVQWLSSTFSLFFFISFFKSIYKDEIQKKNNSSSKVHHYQNDI